MKQCQLCNWDILANCTAFDNGQEVTWLFWLWQLGELPCKLFKSHHCEGYFFQHLLLHFWAVTSCTLPCWLWCGVLGSILKFTLYIWAHCESLPLGILFPGNFRLTAHKLSFKERKRYKYLYNLVYPSPFLTIDWYWFHTANSQGVDKRDGGQTNDDKGGKGRTEDDTRWQRGDIRQKICLDI